MACIDDFCQDLHKKTVIVMDQASIHTSKAFTAKIPEWQAQNIEIFYLPAYTPELNMIEILWRFMKYAWIELWASPVKVILLLSVCYTTGLRHRLSGGGHHAGQSVRTFCGEKSHFRHGARHAGPCL